MLDALLDPAFTGVDLILVIGALTYAIHNYIKEGKPNDHPTK